MLQILFYVVLFFVFYVTFFFLCVFVVQACLEFPVEPKCTWTHHYPALDTEVQILEEAPCLSFCSKSMILLISFDILLLCNNE